MKSTSNETYHDLLQFMIAAAHEENSGVTAQSFADNLLTFLFAGFDTTSISLSYVLYLMASHPDVQEKALAEVLAETKSQELTYKSAQELVYCTAIITESLRLFPPALVTSRTLEDEVTIGKHRIPRGTTVMLPIYWIHRYDANWGSDADRFRPERHLEDSDDINLSAKDKGFRMLAFSGGPRNCVGMRYAMLETVVVLAVLLQRCVFSVAKDAPPVRPVVSGLVQKPEHGVWLNIQPRKA
ncbi:unnamed protein product [Aphanomyces euteiches]